MSLRDEWKETGANFGHAFGGLGKNIGRSVKDGIGAADDAISDRDTDRKKTVFNDGSWRGTGKALGGAFTGLAKSIVRSARTGLAKIDKNDPLDDETKDQADHQV